MVHDVEADEMRQELSRSRAECEALRAELARHGQVEAELRELARFPAENPNPVLRVAADGTVLYANQASGGLLREWTDAGGTALAPDRWRQIIAQVLAEGSPRIVDITRDGREYVFTVVPVQPAGYVNLYGADTTERRQAEAAAEEARRQAEQRAAELDAVLSTIPTGVAIYGPDGRLVHTNDFAKTLLGLTPEYEAAPLDERMRLRRFVFADGRPATKEETPAYRALHGEMTRHQILGVYEGEAVTWVSVSAAPLVVPAPGGDVQAGAIVTFSDVTQLREMQERLQQANEELERERARLQVILEKMPAGVIVGDLFSGRLIVASEQMARLWRRPIPVGAGLEAYSSFPGFHPDGRPYEPQEWPLARAGLLGEAVDGEEMSILRGDGTLGTMLVSASPVRDRDGQITGCVSIALDVTERKEMEEALQRSQERYRAFIDHSSEAIWRVELEHPIPVDLPEEEQLDLLYQEGYVAECNVALARLHDFDRPEEAVGIRLGQILPRLSPVNERHLRAFIQSGYHIDGIESTELGRGGTTCHFVSSFIGIVDDGHLARLWVVQRDITERKVMEAQREAALLALQAARDELELRVQERTAELSRANATLEQRVAERTRELTSILSISHHLASELELEPLLKLVLDEVEKLVGYTTLAVYGVEGELLTVLEYRGPLPREEVVGASAPLSSSFGLSKIVAERAPLFLSDVRDGSELAQVWRRAAHPKRKKMLAGAKSWMAVPLIARGRVIGVLRLAHDRPGYYDEQKVQWGVALADTVAVAIDNARLYRQARDLAVLEERQRLARDLHDVVSQTLFSAGLTADVLPQIYARDPVHGQKLLDDLRRMNRGALAELRALLAELRPTALFEVDLGTLVIQLTEAIAGRSETVITVAAEPICPLPPNVQVALYRIAQEALNNVAKHARARQAAVRLSCMPGSGPEAERVELCVEDDGCGFDLGEVPATQYGLNVMAERARAIGAALTIDTRPGAGTRVAVVWPGETG